jgi:hypothetical protein
MNTLAHILENLPENTAVGQMVKKAKKNSKRRILRNVKPRRIKVVSQNAMHVEEVVGTRTKGFGALRPCNTVEFKPGSRALAHGRPCEIKWCLTAGKLIDLVVVLFDTPQEIRRKPGLRSRWAIIVSEFVEKPHET